MKKVILYFCSVLWILIIASGMVACSGKELTSKTSGNATPDSLYKQDNEIDLFVYQDTAYVNAVTVDWVTELELKQDKKLGEIERTNVIKKFKDYDATLLDKGTEIYSVSGRKDIILANINNMMIPYLAFVEG